MVDFLQIVISGLSIGCVYALVALGFVLIYKATEVVNFAQGELMMVGAFFAYTFVDLAGLPFAVGLPVAMASTALFGALLNQGLLRPLIGRSPFTTVPTRIPQVSMFRAVLDAASRSKVLMSASGISNGRRLAVVLPSARPLAPRWAPT